MSGFDDTAARTVQYAVRSAENEEHYRRLKIQLDKAINCPDQLMVEVEIWDLEWAIAMLDQLRKKEP